ncbi:hypothetical protein BTAR23_AR23_06227 [Bacillus thuringiensis serovar israelensis]|uniref:Uncharacterized protein n=1 Tax=Bacillus thuringiensis subsp. israelensis TaxID=1430 RepID=A0AAX3HYR9_BACTI|nr:hypothetical protein BTAR23_AR23_06227 [Bacillus thuringiensis serovar israelensis]
MSKQRSKISTFIIKKSVRSSSPKDYRLFFFIMSLQNFFRLVCFSRQAEGQKAMQWFSTWTSKYTSRTAKIIRFGLVLIRYDVTFQTVGSRPHTTSQHSKQKAMEDQRARSKQRELASYGYVITYPKNDVFDLVGDSYNLFGKRLSLCSIYSR